MDIRLLVVAFLGCAFMSGASRTGVKAALNLHQDLASATLRNKADGLRRLRAFNATGLRMLRAGVDLPLEAPSSFVEEDYVWELPSPWNSKLKVVSKIGEGSFGIILKCEMLCKPGTFVTVKLVSQKTEMMRKEMEVLDKMRDISDLCISSIGTPSYIETNQGFWVMMPYMNRGELYDLIRKCDDKPACKHCGTDGRRCWEKIDPQYTTPLILSLFHDVVHGVDILYKKTGLLHTDLKPENAMINCQGFKCFAAVIDLGCVCNPKDPDECGLQGTPGYIPPEVWEETDETAGKTSARDVWALGVILYQLLYAERPPFYADSFGFSTGMYDSTDDPNIPTPRTRIDELVIQMLAHDAAKRPSLAKIMMTLKQVVVYDFPESGDLRPLQNLALSPTERNASKGVPLCLSDIRPEQVGHRGHVADLVEPVEEDQFDPWK
ncbi:PRKACB, partial [Symbiodinium pilosum]